MTTFITAICSLMLWNLSLVFANDDCIEQDLTRISRKFPSLAHIKAANDSTIVPSAATQYLFIDINTGGCDVYITKWMFKGGLQENSNQQYPIFQLWDNELGNVLYTKEESTYYSDVQQPITQTEDGMIEFILKTPIQFDDDDIIGMYIPSNPTPVYFEVNPSQARSYLYIEAEKQRFVINTIFNNDLESGNQWLPLITVEMSLLNAEFQLKQTPNPVTNATKLFSQTISISENATKENSVAKTISTLINRPQATNEPNTMNQPNQPNNAMSQLNVPVQSTTTSKEDFKYHSLAHAVLIGAVAIVFFVLILIVFTTSTCIIIRVVKKQPKTIPNTPVVTNAYTRDSLITNNAYSSWATHPYDKLVRVTSSVQVDSQSNQQISNAVSMPNMRFSQSLPLPEIPQSLPLPLPTFLKDDHSVESFPRSKTISEFSHCSFAPSHMYDLPFQRVPKIPQEYEQPV